MSKNNNIPKEFKFVKSIQDISEFVLKKNGLRVVYKYIHGTSVVTSNLTYLVGSKDELPGETGLAHMFEHMLFKPTRHDLKLKQEPASMKFEREVGIILNANTWKDRTTYYFSYEKSYFARAIKIEAERMKDLVLTDKEFKPERTNVLSEFDMYNGDPQFALSCAMVATAFHSHSYGHETIGFREDIEAYTVEKLDQFYKKHYQPGKAVFSIVGDISIEEVLKTISREFGDIENDHLVPRERIQEPKQEGLRRIEINRPGVSNVIAIGFKHAGFPNKEWYATSVLIDLLAGGDDSVLHKKLVDTGLVTSVTGMIEPANEMSLGIIYITMPKKANLEIIEKLARDLIAKTDTKEIKKHLSTVVSRYLAEEKFGRESSMNIVSQLTEYISAGSWESYYETEGILKAIQPNDLLALLNQTFAENNLTIGHYKCF